MRTVYISEHRADRMAFVARGILARFPGMLLIFGLLVMFFRDPLFPYRLITHPWIGDFLLLLTNSNYRMGWLEQYGLMMAVLLTCIISFGWAFKVGIWNKAFKMLRVRTDEVDDLTDIEMGRCYWIERRVGASIGGHLRGFLRATGIMDIQIGSGPQRKVRKLRDPLAVAFDDSIPPPPELPKPRVIFYKAGFFPLLNPWNPGRSMSRLVAYVSDEDICSHDGSYILVVGQNLERDMSQPYPTYYLTKRLHPFVDLDVQQYRDEFDKAIEKATYTITQASNMDTFLLKEQKKYQEVSISVDKGLVALEDSRRDK